MVNALAQERDDGDFGWKAFQRKWRTPGNIQGSMNWQHSLMDYTGKWGKASFLSILKTFSFVLPINCNGRILTGYFQFFLTQPSYIKMLISSGMAVFFYLVIKKQQQQERIFNRTIIPAWYLPLKILYLSFILKGIPPFLFFPVHTNKYPEKEI